MTQTAIEWLIEQFSKHYAIHQLEDEIEQAKEREKQEIADAYEEGYNRAAKVIEDETQRILKDNI